MKRGLWSLAFLVVTTANALAQNLAIVNGVPIPMSRYDNIVSLGFADEKQPTSEQKEQIKQYLINLEVLSQTAKAQGLGKTDAYKTQMELSHAELLGRMLLDAYIKKNPVTDAQIQTAYATANKSVPQEYKAKHILVKTEKQAQDALLRLKKGEAFDTLAKELSEDPGSAPNGGELGWAPSSNYVPEFANALRGLDKDEISKTPVKTVFGYHLIFLEDVREPAFPPLDEIKPRILAELQQQKITDYLASLHAAAKVE